MGKQRISGKRGSGVGEKDRRNGRGGERRTPLSGRLTVVHCGSLWRRDPQPSLTNAATCVQTVLNAKCVVGSIGVLGAKTLRVGEHISALFEQLDVLRPTAWKSVADQWVRGRPAQRPLSPAILLLLVHLPSSNLSKPTNVPIFDEFQVRRPVVCWARLFHTGWWMMLGGWY